MKRCNLFSSIQDFYSDIISTLFPSICLYCNKIIDLKSSFLCNNCLKRFLQIDYNSKKICSICSEMLNDDEHDKCADCMQMNRYFDKNRSIFFYNDFAKHIIQIGKFQNQFGQIGYKDLWFYLGELIVSKIDLLLSEIDLINYIIPVPLSQKRFKSRTFNQSEILANKLSISKNIPILANNLIKIKDVVAQSTLSSEERKTNIMDSYKVVDNNILYNKNILLIDDIFTTGSTVNECSKVLKSSGCDKIIVLTLFRATGKFTDNQASI